MSRGSKVGGTKRRVLDIVGFAAIVVLFLLYMVPFILVLLNSFKQKRDIIKNPFSRVFFALMAASMIIPFQAIMIPLVSIYGSGLHMLNHRLTLIFMHTGFAMSMSVFIYQGFIKSGIPLSLEEAAYLDGCTQCTDIFQDCISTVETDHSNPCDLKCTGILERLSASFTGTYCCPDSGIISVPAERNH